MHIQENLQRFQIFFGFKIKWMNIMVNLNQKHCCTDGKRVHD